MKLNQNAQNALLDIRAHLVAQDIQKANNLRKSRHIAKVKPGQGPRIAR